MQSNIIMSNWIIPLNYTVISVSLIIGITMTVLASVSLVWVLKFRKMVFMRRELNQRNVSGHASLKEETRKDMLGGAGIPSMEQMFNIEVFIAMK